MRRRRRHAVDTVDSSQMTQSLCRCMEDKIVYRHDKGRDGAHERCIKTLLDESMTPSIDRSMNERISWQARHRETYLAACCSPSSPSAARRVPRALGAVVWTMVDVAYSEMSLPSSLASFSTWLLIHE